MKAPDILAALEPVANTFDQLGVAYYIGGSVASSAYGIPRATLDVDIIADMGRQHVRPLVKALESDYYVDEEMILEAIHRHSSFNLIHLETIIKVDVFVAKESAHEREIFRRKRKDTLDEAEEGSEFYLASAEDVVLKKLEWFRLGGEASEQQWRDVKGMLKVQRNLLDREYLRRWAEELDLWDLLEQAVREAEI